jgi:signal transduction histidine kinase
MLLRQLQSPDRGCPPAFDRRDFMKKTARKKLALAKETVRSLEAMALEKVEGGAVISHYCDTWRYCPNEPNPY